MSKKSLIYMTALAAAILIAGITMDFITGSALFTSNTYNSYSLQASRWLSGHLDLGRDYTHLELAYYNSKVFVSFPPFPSVVLLPFVLLFGVNTPDHIITLTMCVAAAIYAFKLCKNLRLNDEAAFFLSLFATIGSNFLFIMVRGGWVWFIAQVMSFLFTTMSFYYASKESKSPLPRYLSPFFLACAVGCRPFQIVYAPITAYLLYKHTDAKTLRAFILPLIKYAIPAALLCCFYLSLNIARFDSPFEFGHNYLPEFVNSENGQFSTIYLSENINRLFRLPFFDENNILTFYKFDGTAFWLISPIFLSFAALTLYLFAARRAKSRAEILLYTAIPLMAILHLLFICSHKTMGGWHFGNRYTIDALPAILTGMAAIWHSLEKSKNGASSILIALNAPLFVLGLFINIAGTYRIYLETYYL